MSNETPVTHWPSDRIEALIKGLAATVPLKEYFDMRVQGIEDKLEALREFNAQHFALNEKAITKAEEAMTLRLEGMNEFRTQITNERMNYVTKERWEATTDVTAKRLTTLEQAAAFSAGKLWMIMAAFALIPTVIAIIAFVKR